MRLIDADALKHRRGIAGDEILHEIIDTQPTIDAEPVRHGRWIEGCCELRCSACRWKYSDELPFMSTHGLDSMSEAFAYCPHCGARMGGVG